MGRPVRDKIIGLHLECNDKDKEPIEYIYRNIQKGECHYSRSMNVGSNRF